MPARLSLPHQQTLGCRPASEINDFPAAFMEGHSLEVVPLLNRFDPQLPFYIGVDLSPRWVDDSYKNSIRDYVSRCGAEARMP